MLERVQHDSILAQRAMDYSRRCPEPATSRDNRSICLVSRHKDCEVFQRSLRRWPCFLKQHYQMNRWELLEMMRHDPLAQIVELKRNGFRDAGIVAVRSRVM